MRAPAKKKPRRAAPAVISAVASAHIRLETHPDGNVFACFDDYAIELGKFSGAAALRAQQLRTGLPLKSFASGRNPVDKEVDLLVRRMAQRGLLEYRLGHEGPGHKKLGHQENDQVVIEPQMPDYWPRTPKLGGADRIVLSRFAYLRRRGNEMILESPRAGALFRICDPKVAATITLLTTPQTINKLRRQNSFPGTELFALLLDCHILFKIDVAGSDGLRADEGDDNLVLWDFHDLLFHTHSTEGRQANPLGGLYPYADVMPPPPATRANWPGNKIDLPKPSATAASAISPFTELMRERHSTRGFDDGNPITLAELSHFLDGAARIQFKWQSTIDQGDEGPVIDYTTRPYPAAGSSYELELYLTVANCKGLARGFYHYDADRHALVAIDARPHDLEMQLTSAEFAMDAPGAPQILITMAARFNRISWKYSSIAYSLILKDVGVLIQTLYLMATDMGLGGCAIGSNNIDLFAQMTGIEFHVEGPVGQFALGRGMQDEG
ncbi:MAG: SagB family peptide dehydrogenase [Bradyrhizobium sp.]